LARSFKNSFVVLFGAGSLLGVAVANLRKIATVKKFSCGGLLVVA
jgi:hypothetical protein